MHNICEVIARFDLAIAQRHAIGECGDGFRGTLEARLSSNNAQTKSLPCGLLKGKLKMRSGFDDPLP